MDYEPFKGQGGGWTYEQRKGLMASRKNAPQSPSADKKSIGQMTDEELQKEYELKILELNKLQYAAQSAFGAMNAGRPVGGPFGYPQRTVSGTELSLQNYIGRLSRAIFDRKKRKQFSEQEQSIRSKYG